MKKRRNNLWIIETQHQRAYKIQEVRKVLEKIGFKDIRMYDDYNEKDPNDKSERVVFTAIRR